MKISCARNMILVSVSSLMLAGCFEDDTPSETTRSVEWYQEHAVEREDKLKECANNPGELENTPNCVNALQAARLESSGSLRNVEIPPLQFGKRGNNTVEEEEEEPSQTSSNSLRRVDNW